MAAKRVAIKNFGLDMTVKNTGIELEVYDGGTFLGDLIVTKTGLIWCRGKITRKNGVKAEWWKFMEWMNSLP